MNRPYVSRPTGVNVSAFPSLAVHRCQCLEPCRHRPLEALTQLGGRAVGHLDDPLLVELAHVVVHVGASCSIDLHPWSVDAHQHGLGADDVGGDGGDVPAGQHGGS